jgi:hypothetical protein
MQVISFGDPTGEEGMKGCSVPADGREIVAQETTD